jgi:hypothetical protein
MSDDEMSRLLDEFDTSLFRLIKVRTRIATIVKRNQIDSDDTRTVD